MIYLENIVFEALVENLMVSRYCINFRKDPEKWKREGCYGFPAAILLFSIVDTIGSYIIGGKTREHFNIFNNPDYYNLSLPEEDIDELYKNYRSLLTHNGALPLGRILAIGESSDGVIKKIRGAIILNLIPFWNVSYYSVEKFLKEVQLENNSQANLILKIPEPIV